MDLCTLNFCKALNIFYCGFHTVVGVIQYSTWGKNPGSQPPPLLP